MLLVTGPVAANMKIAVQRATRRRRSEAGRRGGRLRLHGRHLRRELRQLRPVANVIPVDVAIPGCRAALEILRGILTAVAAKQP